MNIGNFTAITAIQGYIGRQAGMWVRYIAAVTCTVCVCVCACVRACVCVCECVISQFHKNDKVTPCGNVRYLRYSEFRTCMSPPLHNSGVNDDSGASTLPLCVLHLKWRSESCGASGER